MSKSLRNLTIGVVIIGIIFSLIGLNQLIRAVGVLITHSTNDYNTKIINSLVVNPQIITETVTVTNTITELAEPKLNYMGQFKITYYCACEKCCGKTDGITATGTQATEGRTIAVNPKQILYGSKVLINGHTYIAEDCGGAITDNRIDIYVNTHERALQFGVDYADVYVLY